MDKKQPNLCEKKEECCGCTACRATCPTNAIKFEYDLEGFSYPVVDYDKCIGCLKCLDLCPQKCIHVDQKVKIDQRHCLSCGRCLEICPVRAIERGI